MSGINDIKRADKVEKMFKEISDAMVNILYRKNGAFDDIYMVMMSSSVTTVTLVENFLDIPIVI